MTIGELKKYIEENNLDDDSEIVISMEGACTDRIDINHGEKYIYLEERR